MRMDIYVPDLDSNITMGGCGFYDEEASKTIIKDYVTDKTFAGYNLEYLLG